MNVFNVNFFCFIYITVMLHENKCQNKCYYFVLSDENWLMYFSFGANDVTNAILFLLYHILCCRVLKPFIRRDCHSKPLKLKLLEEIKAYPYRFDELFLNLVVIPYQ